MSLPNPPQTAECAYCHEISDRCFTPPLLVPDDWREVEQRNTGYWWHAPGIAYPGKNVYSLIVDETGEYLRGSETPDEPICWTCFTGHVSPGERNFLANKPAQITFNGWEAPIWKAI